MFERILEQNCQTFDNFNFEFSMSHHNAHYQPYKKAPTAGGALRSGTVSPPILSTAGELQLPHVHHQAARLAALRQDHEEGL